MLIVTRRDPFYGVIQHLIEILWVQPRHGKFNGHPKIMANFARVQKLLPHSSPLHNAAFSQDFVHYDCLDFDKYN